jgi:short subunit dehydrogenase-like uncharacterized protein
MSSGGQRLLDTLYSPPRAPAVRLRSMTIRDFFRGRSRRARRFLGMGAIAAAVALAIIALTSNLSPKYCYLLAAVGVLGVANMAGALLYLDRTNCPNCRSRLGIQIANQYRLGRLVAFCPFCGVGFDKCEVRRP